MVKRGCWCWSCKGVLVFEVQGGWCGSCRTVGGGGGGARRVVMMTEWE